MTNEAKSFTDAMDHIKNKNYVEAEKIFLELMNEGYIHAQINLATMYLDPSFPLHKHKEAYELLLDAVEKEDGIGAANNLGMMYMAGIHVDRDFHKAYEWFQKGADHEIAACYVNLGKIHAIGTINNGEPDLKSAIKCFIRSYKFGYPFGLDEIGGLLSDQDLTTLPKAIKEDLVEFIKVTFISELEINSNSGDGTPEADLAEMFDNVQGPHSYKAEAVQFYTNADQKGNVKGTNNIGAMYLKGEHFKQNLKQAFSYFKKAAETGDAFAMKNLGCCYLEGTGTLIDLNSASYWLRQSVEAGCEQAIPPLAFTLYNLNPEATSTYIDYMEKACNLNHPECLLILGREYLEGERVNQNIDKGIHLLKRATSLGDESAPLMLGLHYISTEDPKDYANAAKYLLKAVNSMNRHPHSLKVASHIFFNMKEHKEFSREQTFRLNKLFAETGDAEAQARVAALYLEQCESIQDISMAYKYAKHSAEKNCVAGLAILVTLHISGNLPDESLIPNALDRLEEASKNGSAIATFTLGQFYEVGTANIPFDKQLAMDYISRAAKMGYEPAVMKFKKMPKN